MEDRARVFFSFDRAFKARAKRSRERVTKRRNATLGNPLESGHLSSKRALALTLALSLSLEREKIRVPSFSSSSFFFHVARVARLSIYSCLLARGHPMLPSCLRRDVDCPPLPHFPRTRGGEGRLFSKHVRRTKLGASLFLPKINRSRNEYLSHPDV